MLRIGLPLLNTMMFGFKFPDRLLNCVYTVTGKTSSLTNEMLPDIVIQKKITDLPFQTFRAHGPAAALRCEGH